VEETGVQVAKDFWVKKTHSFMETMNPKTWLMFLLPTPP
jgi:hypothetical protein